MSQNIVTTLTFAFWNRSKLKMDMLSLCRKRVAKSPEVKRRSPRIAEKNQALAVKKATDMDKYFANIDSSLPAISQSQNGRIILRILAKPGAKQSGITGNGDTYIYIM